MKRGIVPLLLGLLWMGCNKPDAPDCFKKVGRAGSETRDMSDFHTIHVVDYFTEVLLYQAEDFKVVVESGTNLIPKIMTEVSDGVLTLSNDNRCNFVRPFDTPLRIRVFAPEVRAIRLYAGAGDFTIPETYAVDSLQVEGHDFVGVFDAHLSGRVVNAEMHAGLGDVVLRGALEDVYLYNLGYGFVDARGILSQRAFVNNGSTNEMRLKAPEWYLYVEITGSGNVRVVGHTAQKEVFRYGTGELVFE